MDKCSVLEKFKDIKLPKLNNKNLLLLINVLTKERTLKNSSATYTLLELLTFLQTQAPKSEIQIFGSNVFWLLSLEAKNDVYLLECLEALGCSSEDLKQASEETPIDLKQAIRKPSDLDIGVVLHKPSNDKDKIKTYNEIQTLHVAVKDFFKKRVVPLPFFNTTPQVIPIFMPMRNLKIKRGRLI